MSEVSHLHADPSHKKVALLIAILALILAFAETLAKGAQTTALSGTSRLPISGRSFRRRRFG